METSPGTAPPRRPPRFEEIAGPVADLVDRVEAALQTELRGLDAELAAMLSDVVDQRGKRFRPLLVLLAGRAAGRLSEAHVKLGTVIELVHTASLIHDDVLDGASIRRSRPTLNRAWGTSHAVLLGDILFAHALQVAASFPTTEVCRTVADAARKTCTGEILQTGRRGDLQVSRDDYLRIVELKTAALFEASCLLGARLAGADDDRSAALGEYGRFMGRAYQIYDDCVDIFGDENQVGKSLGTDMATGKLTLPVIVMLERGGEAASRLREELAGEPADRRHDWARRLGRLDVRRECRVVFGDELRSARRALRRGPEPDRAAGLAALADYMEDAGTRLLADP